MENITGTWSIVTFEVRFIEATPQRGESGQEEWHGRIDIPWKRIKRPKSSKPQSGGR
jgi:hypothetical protein